MIDKKQFDARVDSLEQSLQAKLGVRGASLRTRLKRARRLLPKRIHTEGAIVLSAQDKLAHPKLATQVDRPRVAKAFDTINAHLKTIDPVDRRKGKILGWLGGVVFNLMVLGVIVVILLHWQEVV